MKRRRKKYVEMNVADLEQATKRYDEDFIFKKGQPLSGEDKKRHARARKPGRPRIGLGAEKVRITIERGLLREADSFARTRGMSRSELIARGLRAILAAG